MSEFSKNLAVVIGINQYENGISPLQTAVNDVEALSQVLKDDHGYEVVQLVDQQATLEALQNLFDNELPERTQANSRLLFYFAGHGIAVNGDDGPKGYLIPQDAHLGDVNTYLSMVQVHDALYQLPCRHFLGILDCCFAGAFRWSSTRKAVVVEQDKVIHKERYDRFIKGPAWQTITSAAYDQEAMDCLIVNSKRGKTDNNHSPFAAALIEALEGKADAYPPAENGKPAGDGVLTATELYLYLRDRVEYSAGGNQHRQTPGIWPLKKHDKGEYIFLSPGHELNLPPAPPLDESKNPYRGLESFEEEQSDLFFGRQTLTRKLADFVSQKSLTVVLGASGRGKSSLVKAGLIPYLKQQDAKADKSHWHVLAPMRPGESPFKSLSKLLLQEATSDSLMPNLELPAGAEMLTHYMAAWSQRHPNDKLLLAIDQFEELITLCRDDKEREQFFKGLAQAIATYPNQLHLVLTLRSDFEPQFQDVMLKTDWVAARFVVPPMSRSELREAIEEPASKRVMYFQSDDPKNPLVDQLIDEVAEMPGALPLLSFTLSELYLKYLRRQKIAQDRGDSIDRAITEDDYRELGGVARSLTQRADQEYERLVQQDSAYEPTVRHVMLRMVAASGGELARRRVPLSELKYPQEQNERVKMVIHQFSQARLLVEGTDTDGQPYVEPAHDALVRGWQKLLAWKQEHEEDLLLQRMVTPVAEEWKRQQQTKFLWHTNPRLELLKKVFKSDDNWLNQVETEFARRSIGRKSYNTRRNWVVALSVMMGLGAGLVFSLLGLRNAQLEQARTSRQAAELNLATNQEFDALIEALRAGKALKGLMLFGFFKPSGDLALVHGTLSDAVLDASQSGKIAYYLNLEDTVNEEEYIREIFFNQEDQLVAAFAKGEAEKPHRFWNLETQKELQEGDSSTINLSNSDFTAVDGLSLNKKEFGVNNVHDRYLLSPNRRFLVGISSGWNADRPPNYAIFDKELARELLPEFTGYRPLKGNTFVINSDNSKLAIVDSKGLIRVWKIRKENEDSRKALEVAADIYSSTLINDEDKPFDPQDVEIQERIKAKIRSDLDDKNIQDWTDIAKFLYSQDRRSVFIYNDFKNQGFYLWDLETQSEQKRVRDELGGSKIGDVDQFEEAHFSPDSKWLAIEVNNNSRLWNVEDKKLSDSFLGDTDCGVLSNVVFSPDSQLIATYSGSSESVSYVCVRTVSGNQLAKFEVTNGASELGFDSSSSILFVRGYDDANYQAWNIEFAKSFDELMIRGCSLVRSYLKAPNSDFDKRTQHVCDEIPEVSPDELDPIVISFPKVSSPLPNLETETSPTPINPESTLSPTYQANNRGEIKFVSGATSAKNNSQLQPFNEDKYTFRALEGQRFIVYLNPNDEASVSVRDPYGSILISDNDQSGNPALPMDGTYTITVSNNRSDISVPYTLTLEIEP